MQYNRWRQGGRVRRGWERNEPRRSSNCIGAPEPQKKSSMKAYSVEQLMVPEKV
jgi:hypothetical protein